jgi:hypothetical protein
MFKIIKNKTNVKLSYLKKILAHQTLESMIIASLITKFNANGAQLPILFFLDIDS